MPTLLLLRHAKAEPHRDDDHSRVLDARGRGQASDVRDLLLRKGIVPERAVVSTSARTRETWSLADPGVAETVYDARIYEASVADLLEVIAGTPPTVGSLILVGHNPSIEDLAARLDGGGGMGTADLRIIELESWTP